MPEDDEVSPASRAFHSPWERRGADLSRLFALSDGIFAFAMTLLVLSIALPVTPSNGVPGLASQLRNSVFLQRLEAYGLVFVILASYWRAHQLVFQYIRAWDRNLIQINFAFLGLVVLQPFLVVVISDYSGTFAAVALYAGVSALTGFALFAGWWYAAAGRRLIVRSLDPRGVRWLSDMLILTPIIFLASMAIAFVSPDAAEYSWVAVFVLPIVYVRFRSGPGGRLEHAARREERA